MLMLSGVMEVVMAKVVSQEIILILKIMAIFNFTFMNNLLKNIIIAVTSILCMISCQKDIDELAVVAPEEVVMTISAKIDSTRTYIGDESNGIIKWSDDDQLKVIENSTAYSTTSNISIDEDGKALFTVAFAENVISTKFTYNAFFPASTIIEDSKINTEKVKILLIDEQCPTETSFDSKADILISKQVELDSQPTELNMQFKRLVSIGKLTLNNLPADDKIHQVIFMAGDEDVLAGRNYVNATTGEVIRYGYNNSTNTITLNYSKPIATRDVYFTCNPFDMEEGEVFTVVVVCDGTTYTREVTIPAGRSLIFTEGNMSIFSVDMSSATTEDNELSSKFNTPIIQWDMTKDDIIQQMGDREPLYSDDTTLVYSGKGVEDIIAYSFTEDKLDASIAYVPIDKISITDINLLFEEYENIDEYDGYFNGETLTFANVSSDDDYYCIGWAVCEKEKIGSANNKIWYTNGSTTEPTVPNNTGAFGAKIISNKYDSDNECWVITFDSDVKKVGDRAFHSRNLTTITLPNSIISIGEYAFFQCTSLASVVIPDSVTEIEMHAFEYCSNLTTITIPNNLISIGVEAFACCTNLMEFKGKYAADNGRCLIKDNTIIAYAEASGTTYTIPDSVTTIGEYAFYECKSLTAITIPNSVTYIGSEAFYKCSKLTSISIPNSVTRLGGYAFCDCENLKSVYCSATVPPTGANLMFYSNAYGRKIYVYEESVNAYKNANYWKQYADSIVANGNIPDSLTTTIYYTTTNGAIIQPPLPIKSNNYNNGIGEMVVYGELTATCSVFRDCTTLKSITIPNGVTTLSDNAFFNCSNLTSISLPNSVTTLGEYVFCNCENLTNITIPDNVTTIGIAAFDGCSGLTSITIPDSLISIGSGIFRDCANLTEFKGKYAADGGRCLIVDGTLKAFAPAGLNEYTIPDNVVAIDASTFMGCKSLTTITIPDSVTWIGYYAFRECSSLTNVTIPSSVTFIQDGTFYGCESLTSITIPNSVTEMEDSVFYDCYNLKEVYCKATTPPCIGVNNFNYYSNVYPLIRPIGCTIYVPTGSVAAYKSAENWSSYASYIRGYDF